MIPPTRKERFTLKDEFVAQMLSLLLQAVQPQNSLSDLVFVEEMSKFKSPGYWSFLELCDIVRLLECR